MTYDIARALAKIKDMYCFSTTSEGNEVHIDVRGLERAFRLSISPKYQMVYTDTWHEHYDDPDDLARFLEGLFSGNIQIVVKFRGKTPVGHQAQIMQDGKPFVTSWIGAIASPFWRRKSYKRFEYNAAKGHSEPTD